MQPSAESEFSLPNPTAVVQVIQKMEELINMVKDLDPAKLQADYAAVVVAAKQFLADAGNLANVSMKDMIALGDAATQLINDLKTQLSQQPSA